MLDFVEPEDRALVQDRIRLNYEERKSATHVEVRRRRLDGSVRVTETFGIPTVHAGKPAAQVIYRDITARKRAERRDVAFATVAQRLGAASSAEEAARAVADAADDLLGWDAFALYLYTPEDDMLRPVLSFDEVGGRRTAVAAPIAATRPSRLVRRVFAAGGQLILRDGPPAPTEGLTPFGDTARLSASLMFVPIRRGPTAIGFLTIQSYTANAYDAADLATLQMLADQCAGALERTRAEDALRAGERRFRALIEKSADAIALVDAEGVVIYAGPSTEQVLSYRPEEIVGTSISAFIHPEDRPHAAAAMGAILDMPGASASAHYRIRRKDGSWLWLEGTETNRLDDPELGAIVGNYRDITAQKRGEEQARWSEQFLRSAIDALSAHIAVLDETGAIVAVNAAWRQFGAENGFSMPDHGIGANYLDACASAEADDRIVREFLAGIRSVLTGARDRYEMEYPCHSPTEERWFDVRVTHFPGDGPRRVVVAHEDITERKGAEEALRSAETRYRSLVEQIPAIIYLADATRGALLYTSPQREAMLGYTPAEWTAEPRFWEKVIHPDDLERVRAADADAIATGGRQLVEYRYIAKDGRIVWVRDEAWLIGDGDGGPRYWQGVVVDITERKHAEEALRESEERFHAAFDHAAVGISQVTPDGQWLHVNKRLCDLVGYTREELVGHTFSEITHPDDLAVDLGQTRRLLAGEMRTFAMEKRYIHKDGTPIWVNITVSLVRTPAGAPDYFVTVIEGITERKRAEEQLIHNALHDTLTGLPNRALLLDRLQQLLARTARRDDYRFAVLYLDLDRFKTVNDSLGHTLGDDLLRQAGSRLAAAIGPGGTIARLGGDEFVALMEDIADVGDAVRLAERLRDALHAPIVLEERELFVTASIGIALGTSVYRRPEELLRDTDTAMYHAKAAGKDRHVVFAPEMHARAVTRLEMESDLRGAVERGEMRVVYQPIIALATGKVEGFEALLRWDHPRLGTIPTVAFIPVAEETGMIVALDRWALRTACRQIRAWQEARPKRADLTLSVNLSGRQLAEEDLAAVVLATLADTGLAAECLNLEITESALIAHADAAVAILGELSAAGMGIHLDDFGVGYSSLNYLRRFPIDTLKIDRSFVMGEGALAKNEDVLRGIVGLAHGMRMRVVAEGIETAEQLAYLRTLGCDAGQGYYFARPLDAREAASLLGESVPVDLSSVGTSTSRSAP